MLRHRLSSGGGKPVQFLAFGREIPCGTTATRKVTVKPSIHTNAGTINFDNCFTYRYFCYSENRTCMAEVSSSSELYTLLTELSGRPSLLSARGGLPVSSTGSSPLEHRKQCGPINPPLLMTKKALLFY